jgi:hypothetical protein
LDELPDSAPEEYAADRLIATLLERMIGPHTMCDFLDDVLTLRRERLPDRPPFFLTLPLLATRNGFPGRVRSFAVGVAALLTVVY